METGDINPAGTRTLLAWVAFGAALLCAFFAQGALQVLSVAMALFIVVSRGDAGALLSLLEVLRDKFQEQQEQSAREREEMTARLRAMAEEIRELKEKLPDAVPEPVPASSAAGDRNLALFSGLFFVMLALTWVAGLLMARNHFAELEVRLDEARERVAYAEKVSDRALKSSQEAASRCEEFLSRAAATAEQLEGRYPLRPISQRVVER